MTKIMELPLLGRLLSHWRIVEFGSVLEDGTRNGIYKKKEFHGSGDKIVNMGELFAHHRLFDIPMKRVQLSDSEQQRFRLQVGDLLFARRSLVAEGAGKCSIISEINEPTTFESSIIRARPNHEIADSLYLYYLFRSSYGAYILGSILRHVAVAGITGTDLVKLLIPLPPLPEQTAIARILSSLDDKIELNRQMNETLEAIGQTIFKSWFVNFDPVRAKIEGKQPAGMDAATAALFPDEFEESPLGLIPKGWKVKSLDEIAIFLNGLALQKYLPSSEEYLRVIKITELRKGITEQSGKATIDIPSNYIIEDGDILFSWSGSLVNCIWCGGKGALNQHLFKVTSTKYPKWFYYQWVNYHLPEFQFIAAGKATTMGHIQRHHLKEAKVIVPPLHFLSLVDKKISPLIDLIINNNLQSRALATIRDTLLPKLMSGEIRVKEAEKIVEDII